MSLITEDQTADFTNPLDLVEELIGTHRWSFERPSADDLYAEFDGHWGDYQLYFGWVGDVGSMQFACHFDIKVPKDKITAIATLLSVANERLWLGHFGYNRDNAVLYFRHTVLLRGSKGTSVEQLEDLVDIAIEVCERFYPAFQHVIWGGKAPEEALALAMLETAGQA